MYKVTQKKISFFRTKTDKNFIEWICPLLKLVMLIQDMPIYLEQEGIQEIYFLEEGKAAYVLPRYKNAPFVTIEESDTFGIIDIVFRNMQMETGIQKNNVLELEGARGNLMKRKFTVQTVQNSILHQLSIEDLKRM